MSRKVKLFIAMSLDGFIAKGEDDIDFLSMVDTPGEDFGHRDFMNNIDTVIWGRKTYDKVKTLDPNFMYHDRKVYVISRSRTGTEGHVEYAADVVALIAKLQQEEGKDIYCDGGAEVVFELLKHALIDQFIVSVIPHLVGHGVRLFKDGSPEQSIRLTRSLAFPSGLIQLWYEKKAS